MNNQAVGGAERMLEVAERTLSLLPDARYLPVQEADIRRSMLLAIEHYQGIIDQRIGVVAKGRLPADDELVARVSRG